MSEAMHELIKRFVNRNQKWIFAASGNDGTYNRMGYPASWPETISVGAVDKEGRRAKFSNAGDQLDIVAPGVDTLSTIPQRDGGYGSMSGTSMATPIVAGVAALALAKHRMSPGDTGLDTLKDMRDHLRKSAKDTGAPGYDAETGAGIIDAPQLLKGIGKDNNPPDASTGTWGPFPWFGGKKITIIISP
jgi:subtilisin family serine protease